MPVHLLYFGRSISGAPQAPSGTDAGSSPLFRAVYFGRTLSPIRNGCRFSSSISGALFRAHLEPHQERMPVHLLYFGRSISGAP
eukprot:scaffold7084_cov97-Isochrysis_galbana.AAC.2